MADCQGRLAKKRGIGPEMKYPECERCASTVGPANFWGNFGLGIFKFSFGLICGSYALLADAVHSLGDVVTAIAVLLCLWISGKKASEEYPYGHGKIEFLGAGFVGVSLLFVGALIIVVSLRAILRGVSEPPDPIAILVIWISILGNYMMYKHQICVGRQTRSPVILAQARENQADALTSIPAMVGVAGAQLGWTYLDPLAALFIAVIVLKLALKTLTDAAMGLGDAGLKPEITTRVRTAVESVDGVIAIESIKTRRVGPKLEVGLRVKVDRGRTVEWTRAVARKIREAVLSNVEGAELIGLGFQGASSDESQ